MVRTVNVLYYLSFLLIYTTLGSISVSDKGVGKMRNAECKVRNARDYLRSKTM